jgi:hypothetical protein
MEIAKMVYLLAILFFEQQAQGKTFLVETKTKEQGKIFSLNLHYKPVIRVFNRLQPYTVRNSHDEHFSQGKKSYK